MKQAFLVLAHHRQDKLAKLLKLLKSPDSFVVCHLDKKSTEDFSPVKKQFPEVHFFSTSEIHWGAWSVVQATLAMISIALQDKGIARLTLVSGEDVVLADQNSLAKLADDRNDYMAFWGSTTKNNKNIGACPPFQPYVPHHYNIPFLCAGRPLLKWHIGEAARQRLLNISYGILDKLFSIRGLEFDVYKGSQWWSLRRDTTEAIVAQLNEHPTLQNYLRFAHAPDELAFQTAYKLCGLKGAISIKRHENIHGIHYIDWGNFTPPVMKLLNDEDLEIAKSAGALFARKSKK